MLLDFKTKPLVIVLMAIMISFASHADKSHDPTMPKLNVSVVGSAISTDQESQQATVLQGIVNKRNSRMAIISGRLTNVGDEVDGYRVSQINKNNVVLIKAGSQKRLYVYEK